MANQMIALQTRNPQLPDPSKMASQYATMMNLAQQNETSRRQGMQAQQAMDIKAAEEARAVDLQKPALAEAGSKATSAMIKTAMDFNNFVRTALSVADTPDQVVELAGRIARQPQFQDEMFQGSLQEAVASMPRDPALFEPWKKKTALSTLEADKRYKVQLKTQNTGTEERIVAISDFGGDAVEVPGSRFEVAEGTQIIKGPDGATYTIPKKIGGSFGAPAPAVGTPTPRGAPGQGNTADVVYGFGKYGSPDKPLSTMRMGDVQNFQKELINKTRGRVGAGPNKGTGAVGTYQFTYETLQDMAPKVFGANWRDKPFTADAQEKLAKALYEERKGGNLKDTWAGLPSNRPGQYANVPWEQVRDKIIKVESAGGGNRQTPTGGTSNAAPGGLTKILPGKPVAGALTPEKKLARDTAVQNLFDDIQAAQKKGHLVSDKQSYIANRAAELRRGRPYAPGGTAQKTSLDKIDATATQLLRQFIEKGTSGTLNTKVEQENFLRGVGGGDSTYETRIDTLRNFAKQNGIKINEGGPTKSKAAPPKVATPTTKAPPGISPEDWKYMSPAERKLWVK